jgi:hypothetical protein
VPPEENIFIRSRRRFPPGGREEALSKLPAGLSPSTQNR